MEANCRVWSSFFGVTSSFFHLTEDGRLFQLYDRIPPVEISDEVMKTYGLSIYPGV